MSVLLYCVFFVLGSVFGSFACCQAYRIRYRQIGKKIGKRSECLNCAHRLKWYELIPIVSWVALKGRCTKCKQKIGLVELLSEIAMGIVFCLIVNFELRQCGAVNGKIFEIENSVLSTILLEPVVITYILLLLAAAVLFWILLIYDFKWQGLPSGILMTLIVISISYLVVNELVKLGIINSNSFGTERRMFTLVQKIEIIKRDAWVLAGGVAVLPMLYFFLYKISKEKLVGGGDYLLSLSMVLFLERFDLALTLLCLSNLLAFAFNVRNMLQKKRTRIAFGPYLILAFWVVFFLSKEILYYLYVTA